MRLIFIRFVLFLLASNVMSDGHRIDPFLNPLHYDLVLLHVIKGGSPRLCDHVYIDVQPTRTTNLITFHTVELTIIDVSVRSVGKEMAAVNPAIDDRFLQLEDLCILGSFRSKLKGISDDPGGAGAAANEHRSQTGFAQGSQVPVCITWARLERISQSQLQERRHFLLPPGVRK
jgi:hypothetical protein